jgi:rod shape-determining protein MreC
VKIQKQLTLILIALYIAIIYFSPPEYINKPKFVFLEIFRLPLAVTHNIFKEINFLFNAKGMIRENVLLYDTVAALTHQICQHKELEQENKRLRKLLGFAERSDFDLIAASIIAKDSSNLSDTIVIDRGKANGIEKDTVVISEAGLVGRIHNASANTSRVMLLTDVNSRVSAVVSRTRQLGIIYGTSSGMCRLRHMPIDADIDIDDDIVSSGLSDIYPKGILIGRVVDVFKEPGGLSVSATIRPSVDFTRLEEVLCLR